MKMDRSSDNRHSGGLEREPTTLTLAEFYAPTPELTDDEQEKDNDQREALEEIEWSGKQDETQNGTSMTYSNNCFPRYVNDDSVHNEEDLKRRLHTHVVTQHQTNVTIPTGNCNETIIPGDKINNHGHYEVGSSSENNRTGFDDASVQKVEYKLRKRLTSVNSRSARSPMTRSSTNYFRVGKEEAATSNKCLAFVQFSDIKTNFTSRTRHQRQNGMSPLTGNAVGGYSWNGDGYNKRSSNNVNTNRISTLYIRNPSSRYRRTDLPFLEQNGRSGYTRGQANTSLIFGTFSLTNGHRDSPLLIEKLSTPRSSRLSTPVCKRSVNTPQNTKHFNNSASSLLQGHHEHGASVPKMKYGAGAVCKMSNSEHQERHSAVLRTDTKECFSIQNRFLPVTQRRQVSTPVYRFSTPNDEKGFSNILIGNKQSFID